MPTYDYKCACGTRISVNHPMPTKDEDGPTIECPDCLVPMSRVPNFGTSILRGPGFYKTGG